MPATIGTGEPRTISRSARPASGVSQVTRTMSAPAAAARSIWASVPATSSVWVLVMVWTEIGAAPPITTPPTLMGTVRRRLGGVI